MTLHFTDTFALLWFAGFSATSCLMFGFDKWQASRGRWRVRESALIWLGLLGGWPGGMLGMMVFRHKSAKRSFQFKYALAVIPFAAEVWVCRHGR